MRIAVTGASGFVGSHVVEALVRFADIDVVAVGRSGRPHSLPPSVEWLTLDLHREASASFERLGRPDTLIHLAWDGLPNYLSPHHYERELPLQYSFLKAMIEQGLSALVVTGTCYEYGMLNGPLAETLVPSPANPYAFAKDALRRQLEFVRQNRVFSLTWARLFYMYGPRQAAGSLKPLFDAAIARNDATFAMSGGEQLRDYLPVERVAMILARLGSARPDAGLVNVCSGKPVAVRSLVEQWRSESASTIELDIGRFPYPSYEPMAFWGSTTKLQALFPDLGMIP